MANGTDEVGRQTALITGASSGIGLELARLFAAGGYDLVLVARSAGRLEELAGELRSRHGAAARALAKDLTHPESPEEVFRELEAAGVAVDVLVNNAGFGTFGPFAETDLDQELRELQLNVVTLTHLTKRFLPGMLARGRGGVLNVGSTAGFQPGPLMAVYYATKAYVLSFSEALAEELAGTALRGSCLAPGPAAAGVAGAGGITGTRLFRLGTMSAADVARIGFDGWSRGRVLVVPGLT